MSGRRRKIKRTLLSIRKCLNARAIIFVAGWICLAGRPVMAPAAGQAADYARLFGAKYEEAAAFIKSNAWMTEALALEADEARLALAVVFPEIVRFGSFEDMIQVRALKVFYVQYGKKYANFSVGRFQMKPVFVEQLERDANRLLTAEERAAAGVPVFPAADSVEVRRDRVLRLDDQKWQVRYLGLFMRIMDRKHPRTAFADVVDRLRFYATAYNAGYTHSEKTIRRLMTVKSYHTELFDSDTKYGYADIAAFYFSRRK
jgi:hypothetical protein